jgi:hypothetical protein
LAAVVSGRFGRNNGELQRNEEDERDEIEDRTASSHSYQTEKWRIRTPDRNDDRVS